VTPAPLTYGQHTGQRAENVTKNEQTPKRQPRCTRRAPTATEFCAELSQLPRPGVGGGAGHAAWAVSQKVCYQRVYNKKRQHAHAGRELGGRGGRREPVRRQVRTAYVRFPPRLTKFLLAEITSGAYATIASLRVTQSDYCRPEVTGCNPIKH